MAAAMLQLRDCCMRAPRTPPMRPCSPSPNRALPAFLPSGGEAREDEQSYQGRLRIGRWGEEAVYHYLRAHPDVVCGAWQVEWVNQGGESGGPFDLLLRQVQGGRQVVHVEVKSSSSLDKDWFELPPAELEMAREAGEGYHLYRVTGAGSSAPRLLRVVDPVLMWQLGAIRVCMQV
jgi:hypothetical protein